MTPVLEDDALLYLLQDALITMDPARFGFLNDEMEDDGDDLGTAGAEAARNQLKSDADAVLFDEETLEACKQEKIVDSSNKKREDDDV